MSEFDPRQFIQTLSLDPGVYRMLDAQGKLLYVGKARNLKKRVAAYFSRSQRSPRLARMISQTAAIETTVTHTEAEALLLENNLIKRHRPRYNILLRDDKSYPYIFISSEHDYPQITFYRGRRERKGRYFGPYASPGAARSALNLLQKVFRVRPCDDYFFSHRSRPCLQYQIDRCSGPCVGLIDKDSYGSEIEAAIEFLEGNSHALIARYVNEMDQASANLDYEAAARARNKIEMLRKVSEQQYVSAQTGDVDIAAVEVEGEIACVQVFNIRAGMNLGNKSYFPRIPDIASEEKIINAFLGQYYLGHSIPEEIILSHRPEEAGLLQEVLSSQAGRKVSIVCAPRAQRARWLDMARKNALGALQGKLASKAGLMQRFEATQDELGLEFVPQRIECFDVSHTRGEATVASCVVFEQEGPLKTEYRRFNIEGVRAGDDYAALHQALTRRYLRLKKGEGKLPDLLLIDGGKGQVAQARDALLELQVEGVCIVGVAKGPHRKAGEETLILGSTGRSVRPAPHSLALRLIQQIRDEAHRFAISGHRKRRARARVSSPLERIAGLGPKRRQNLLKHFGGMRGISRAGVEEIAKVPGVSRHLAQAIYQEIHSH